MRPNKKKSSDHKSNINYKIKNLMNDSARYEVNYQKLLILK